MRFGEKMWFGTENRMVLITPPKSGAESSPVAWGADGTYMNGGGYAFNSQNSHKVYQYAWPASSSRAEAQQMKNYADGVYGTGKIYFTEPNIYDQNVLPARWAAPSLTANHEGPSIVPNLDGEVQVPNTGAAYNTPVQSMKYDFQYYVQTDPRSAGVFIPIPPEYFAAVTAFGEDSVGPTGVPKVYAAQVSVGGNVGYPTAVEVIQANDGEHGDMIQGTDRIVMSDQNVIGMRLWIGAQNEGEVVNGTITVRALQVRLYRIEGWSDLTTLPYEGWTGGMGNAGCRFVGKPTYITHNAVNGSQIEYAATLKEVLY